MAVRSRPTLGANTSLSELPVLGVGFLAILAVLSGLAVFLNTGSYDVAMSMVVLLVIVVASIPVLRWLADRDGDPALFRITMAGLVTKMAFSLVRYWVIFIAYNGEADAARYDSDGWLYAQKVRAGNWIPAIRSIDDVEDATRRIIKLTGYAYTIIGRSKFGAFFLFSWLAFWGAVLFLRGAKRAFPELDHRRFTYLMMFFPSLLFWPSSIGKDAVMIFLLGVVFYGAGLLLGPRARLIGVLPFVAGMGGMVLIRAHVAAMAALAVVVATGFAALGGSKAEGVSIRGRMVRIVALVVMVGAASVAVTQTSRFFTQEAGEATSTEGAMELTLERTMIGKSAFQPVLVTTPALLPAGTLSVLFRPLPWEAKNVGNLIAAGESLLLLALVAVSVKRLRYWPSSAWRRPILIFAAVYTLMFVVAFSSIGNGGILARQRVQLLPFVLLAVSVPATRWWKRPVDEHADGSDEDGPAAPDDDPDADADGSSGPDVPGGGRVGTMATRAVRGPASTRAGARRTMLPGGRR
ncbi:hypothetical protein [Dermatobacter hominis]|uniref:hypothetical protein n=1 Tax=Dermatobacter hominis TaxID=2884263 RepID=UPI001D0F5419|nr:hypothetical protein [Dermatobacter hominis]UDY33923.1 hypothetical protein LH044_11255 [Dermatobacter hominis]